MPAPCRRLFLTAAASAWALPVSAQSVSKGAAVALAEAFIAKNGYTQLPRELVNTALTPESFELGSNREQQLTLRFNSLKPRAIGVKRGSRGEQQGWSVAFDYVQLDSSACRVVTMDDKGNKLVMQHQDGIRSYFIGFD